VSSITGVGGYLDILVKAGLGGVLIAVILLLARGRQYVLSGLLVSVPVVSLYIWWWINAEHGPAAVRVAVRAAMWGAVPWVAYLGVVYALAGRAPMWLALAAGVLTWFVLLLLLGRVLQGHG